MVVWAVSILVEIIFPSAFLSRPEHLDNRDLLRFSSVSSELSQVLCTEKVLNQCSLNE